MSIINHPSLRTRAARLSFAAITVLRALFFALIIYALHPLIDYGTSAGALSLSAFSGVLLSSFLAFTRLRTSAVFVLLFLLGLGLYGLFSSLELAVPYFPAGQIFLGYSFEQHLTLLALILSLAAITTWFFWRFESVAGLELLLLIAVCIEVLAGHRNFHFDTPAIINSMAWALGVEHLSMLIILGLSILICAVIYLVFSALPGRPLARRDINVIQTYKSRNSKVYVGFAVGAFCFLVYLISRQVYQHYNLLASSRMSNGVGQNSGQGLSPLGFHSALGSTNQPSALVRLEGDYAANPFTPMLYLRESALSEFNGHELVLADSRYDTDVSRTRPEQAYIGQEDVDLDLRVPLIQSIYLMGEHENAFAIDYPLSFSRLKNPEPGRFKAAYKAYSVAPTFALDTLLNAEVGDPRWSEEELQHYLVVHPDKRYSEIARKISQQQQTPVARMQALTDYLSLNAIYTLTPKHEVMPDEDPVAPFLFGDLRGYCVHFAHATVYMARALGIPARIGTGYLTDLSQSKDGHILLRMSDRHAWAEAYIKGFGWVPFDTQPQQVESHAESPVDMNLLEELMGLVGPGEEIIPQEAGKGEIGLEEPQIYALPSLRELSLIFFCLLGFFLLTKAYLRWAWLVPVAERIRVRAAYRSAASRLHDLGLRRLVGETREEFRRRLSGVVGEDLLLITPVLNRVNYADTVKSSGSAVEIARIQRAEGRAIAALPLWKRLLALINPSSVLAFWSRHKW